MAEGVSLERMSGDPARLHSAFARTSDAVFFGFVVDPDGLHRRFTVEIFLDGVSARLLRADQYDPHLRDQGFGDGCYAFEFAANPTWLDRHHMIEARLANTGDRLAPAIVLSARSSDEPPPALIGSVTWEHGVRLSGWVRSSQGQDPSVRAFEGDLLLVEAQADRWAHIESEEKLLAGRIGFELWLPDTLADGRVHRIRVVNEDGLELSGSPVSILAFDDGIRSFLAKSEFNTPDKARLDFLETLLPMSLPFTSYAEWQERFPLPPPAARSRPTAAVVLAGNGDPERSLASLEAQIGQPWIAVLLPQARTIGDAFDPFDLRTFLNEDASDCEVIVFAPSGTLFDPQCLLRFTDFLLANADTLIVYGDIALPGADGRTWPAFLPAFDYERLLEQGYAAGCFALRRDSALSLMAKEPTSLFRLFNAALDEGSPEILDRVTHLPGVTATIPMPDLVLARAELAKATQAHLEATGVVAGVELSESTLFPAVRVRRRIVGVPGVSIIIPTRDRVGLLKTCIDSVESSDPGVEKEIIVVDNESSDEATRAYLRELTMRGIRVLAIPGPFNYSRLNNAAVEAASSEFICLLNNDVEVVEPEWLSELLGRLVDPGVGAVGAMLLWPNGIVQHGGVVLGPYFGAAHAFNDCMRDDPGYCELLHVARECSAVTAACLMLRKDDYVSVNGLDEVLFPVNFNDVDLCLKLRARGYRIVFTPHTALLHFESATRGADRGAFARDRAARELATLRARWGEALANDPLYSPMLNMEAAPYSALAWPPRSFEARSRRSHEPRDIPPGF